jgi:integrase
MLHQFDDFCFENHPDAGVLTKEIFDGWSKIRACENVNGQLRRLSALKGFAQYLTALGKGAYVMPDGMMGGYIPFVPYLYSDGELTSFFEAADLLPPHPCSPNREYIAPVVFRIVYCCGLRPGEVLRLTCTDVDLEQGTLYIADSKKHKDRYVAMSEPLVCLCRKYDQIMQIRMPGRQFFFQNPAGGAYRIWWLQGLFYRCWKSAGITFPAHQSPRIYDWRHNFATRLISGWMEDGQNVAVLLTYLSEYMGHSSLEDTAYYIHLIPERLSRTGFADWDCPAEVPDYED